MQNFDVEIYDMFIDQIESELPHIRYNISSLKNVETVTDAVDNLFRTFHNYKATSSYFSLTPFFNLVSKAEIILNSLRESHQQVPNSIIIWLQQVTGQILIWLDEMFDYQMELSPIPDKLNNKIKLTKPYISPKAKLKSLKILYFDNHKKRSGKMIVFLNKISNGVIHLPNANNIEYVLQSYNFDIIIMNLDTDNHFIINFCKKHHIYTPIIAVFDVIDKNSSTKLMKNNINHIIKNPLNAKLIQNELHLIVNSFFSSVNIVIDNEIINDFIQTLEPLSNTITQVIQICDDDEIPLNTLIKVIRKDAILSGQILKGANNPLYGSIILRTIDQAVVKLGKNHIKALVLNNIDECLGHNNLSPYNITEETFSKVSTMRLSLMLKWYSKISIADLSILSSTALLGNIGQILIAKELISLKKENLFKNIVDTFGVKYAEESVVYTTTNIVSSQILSYWQLSRAIINIIMYSDNPEEAPPEIVKLAVANHIVYTLIPLNGKCLDEVPNELLAIMEKYGFELHILEKALRSVLSVRA